MAKRKPPALRQKKAEQINKKALIWAGSVIGALIVAMVVLLIVNG